MSLGAPLVASAPTAATASSTPSIWSEFAAALGGNGTGSFTDTLSGIKTPGASDPSTGRAINALAKLGAGSGGNNQTPSIPQGASGITSQSSQQQQPQVMYQPSLYQAYTPINADQLLAALRSRSYG